MKRILLIDDNIFESENSIKNLRNQYKVDAVSYIGTARYKLKQSIDYDLIVLDIAMPTQGLFDLSETSGGFITGLVYYERELIHLKIPVLFWSWNADFEGELKNKKWANTDFLLKDVDENHLLLGVNQFLMVSN